MPTAVRRKNTINPVQTFTEFMGIKTDAEKLTRRANELKTRLKDWLPGSKDAYANENGSVFYDLPETVTVGGVDYKGFENRRVVRVTFDTEKAEEILKAKGEKVYRKALSTYIDQEKVALLVQTGELTEADLDEMFQESESYSFYPIKGEVF